MQQLLARIAVLTLALSLVSACSDDPTPGTSDDTGTDVGDAGGDATDAPDVAIGPACADPSVDGPYSVTRDPWTPDDPLRGGTLDALIWYPSADGGPDRSGAPYPLVTLSHGFLMAPIVYDEIARRVASHGFVVVGTKHVDTAETVVDAVVRTCEAIPQSEQIARVSELFDAMFEEDHALRRPRDLATLIDAAAARSAAGGDLEGLIDASRVGAVGHSFGAYTSLAAAGARLDTDLIAGMCADGPQIADLLSGQTLRFLICSLFSTTSEEALAGSIDLRDDRVVALVSLAGPLEFVWGDAFQGLSELPVPTLLVYTDTDEAVTYETGPVEAYPSFPTPKYFLTLFGGNHGNFGTIDFELYAEYVGQVPEGCFYGAFVEQFVGDPDEELELAPEDQRRLSATAVAAFLQKHLLGASGCDAFLSAEFFDTVGSGLQTFVSE